MIPTVEQTLMLAQLEQKHGTIVRVADESLLGEHVLSQCVTDSRAYACPRCALVFTIEPDGECGVWERVD